MRARGGAGHGMTQCDEGVGWWVETFKQSLQEGKGGSHADNRDKEAQEKMTMGRPGKGAHEVKFKVSRR